MHTEMIGHTEFIFREIPFGLSEEMDEIYALRYQVYCNECAFINPDDYPEKLESDEYDRYSMHFIAEDTRGPIGTSRLILKNPHGFPLEDRCKEGLSLDLTHIDHKKVAEVSRLVISKLYRRRKNDGLYYSPDYSDMTPEDKQAAIKRIRPMAFGIYREMYQASKRRGITHWYAIMEKSLSLLLKMHHFVFTPIGPEIDFYGPVRPYLCIIEETERAVFGQVPKLREYFLDGLEQKYHPPIA
ncbi:MAG: PEP-CTERM/exosortase system-associated acyltransferase [Candidatus Omnitrophota bacterium]